MEEVDPELKGGIQPPPVLSTENPFLHPNISPDLHGRERISHSAPDILAIPEVRAAKTNSVSHFSTDHMDESEESRGMSERPTGLRESRSRSRLRGLRFWRKRWKSPGPGNEMEAEP